MYVIDECLNHDPRLGTEFMRDLPELIAQWKMKHNVGGTGARRRTFEPSSFRVLEGGRPPASVEPGR
jgi:hypothetical protein